MSTQIQASVSAALEELSFESLGAEMPGAPSKFQPNQETVERIKFLVDNGKSVVVDSSGEVSFS